MKQIFIGLIIMCLTTSVFGQRTIDSKFGKGLYNVVSEDSSWSMKFGMRFQTLFVGENTINESDGIGAGSSSFLIRRARLKFGGFAFSPKLKYKVELGLSNRDLGKVDERTNFAPRMILDAVLKWNFYKGFELWAGQTKLPGNRERVVSSANMQFVDRSRLNKVYNIDRDIGIQLRHSHKIGNNFHIKEIVSISQGEGRNLVQDNIGGFQYTGRLELLPLGKFEGKGDYIMAAIKREEKPKLAIGVTYDFNDRAVKDKSNQGSYMIDESGENASGYFHSNISTLFADMMFKYKGISFMGEYAWRDADIVDHFSSDSTSIATVATGSGINLCLGYMFINNWEIAARYTQIDPSAETGDESDQQYTLGLSKYFVGHALKVQADVSYSAEDNSPGSGLLYRLQIDLHF
jgi:phosphate-selective porin OprO/OprP